MKRVASILLAACIATTTPVVAFARDNDDKVSKEEEKRKTNYEQGKTRGISTGEEEGKYWGQKDALDGRKPDWEKRFKDSEKDLKRTGVGSMGGKWSEGFEDGLEEGFEAGYVEAYLDGTIKEVLIDSDGYVQEIATRNAVADYHNQRDNNASRSHLSESEIIRRFNIQNEDNFYKDRFVLNFRASYDKIYEEKYKQLRAADFSSQSGEGYSNGTGLGSQRGSEMAVRDFITHGRSEDWARAINEFKRYGNISERYFLSRHSKEYAESFIAGFEEGFKGGYESAYRQSSMQAAQSYIEQKINQDGGVIEIQTWDGARAGRIEIEEATFFKDTPIGISQLRETFNKDNYKYEPVSQMFQVSINNLERRVDLKKPITLRLHCTVDEKTKAGIYEYIDGYGWRYLLTNRDESNDNTIYTEIPSSMYSGGKYAIFLDENYTILEDIGVNWAGDELFTFLRRGYIGGTNIRYYRPNDRMSRAEFASLIWAIQGRNTNIADVSSKFTDSGSFVSRKLAIDHVVSKGYMSGHTDGRFGAQDGITYQQVEWVMRKVLNNSNFNWDKYAQKMQKEKGTRSESVKNTDGKKGYIPKSEVIYMLYELQNNKSI